MVRWGEGLAKWWTAMDILLAPAVREVCEVGVTMLGQTEVVCVCVWC